MARKPSRRRVTIATAVGVTALGGAIAAGVIVTDGGSQSALAGKVSVTSKQKAPVAVGGGVAAADTKAAKKEKCNTVDRYINSQTIPTKYQWHSSVKYCWNGKKVRIVRASSYLKNAGSNVKVEEKPNRIIFNKKHSAVTVMISANVIRPNAWGEVIRHPKVQYRMWAINGAHTYKIIDNEA
ncbi:hypothetical protein [Actinomadura vinacea]|uniref:hypothetical protein n=1 Tax=Actinomadura vinacea TaxID=115336 RepID=UPI0031D824FE